MAEFLPFFKPDLSEEEIADVVDTLRSGWLTYGPKSQAFEREFADMCGARHGIAVNSCTAAMHLSLIASGIGPGDEVITTPITFAATANVIVHTGATPVLADICRDDYNIDPAQIERHITSRTRALIPVHLAGQPCRMDEVLEIAQRHNLTVIEDAAHAHGAAYKGRTIGSISDATCFSFYATKNMTTAEGGMICTNSDELAEKVRTLRSHGLSADAWKRYAASTAASAHYEVAAPGFNYRTTDVNAALGRGQLKQLAAHNARRAELVALYNRRLASVAEVETPASRDDVSHVWHLYAVRLHLDRLDIDRDAFAAALREHGIGTSVHFIPIHYHAYYREGFGFKKGDFPIAEEAFARMISLPLFPQMQESDVDRVCDAIEAVIAEHRA